MQKISRSFGDFVVVLTLLLGLGFVDKFDTVFGKSFSMPMQYLVFLLQFFVMMGSATKRVMDAKVLKLETRYQYVYLMLVVFFVVSMIGTGNRKEQFISCFRFSFLGLFVLWICSNYTVERLLELFGVLNIGYVLLTIFLFVVRPDSVYSAESGGRDFIGIMTTKNYTAAMFELGILFLFVFSFVRKKQGKVLEKRWIVLFVIDLIFLPICHSTGAILYTIVGVGLLGFYGRSKKKIRPPLGFFYALANMLFPVFAIEVLPRFAWFFHLIGKDITLTGRTILWKQIAKVMENHHTMTGYGYTMFWRDERAVALIHSGFRSNSFFGTFSSGSHNVTMELWVSVGLIGLSAFFFAVIVNFSEIAKLREERFLLVYALCVFNLFHGLTERAFGTYDINTILILLMLGQAVVVPKKKNWTRKYKGGLYAKKCNLS